MAVADSPRARLARRAAQRRSRPGPPQFARNPRQDDYGNPTTKRPGDRGTETFFPARKGGRRTFLDLQGRFKPSPYRGKVGSAARKARAHNRGY